MQLERSELTLNRLTALWAFSEAVLGGVLHAAGIPFKGLFLSGVAVIIITLLSHFGARRGEILKITLMVSLVKAVISPHTPPTAYLSIFIQGIAGELLFFSNKLPLISTLVLGVIASMQSALQRVLTLTIFYGENLWKSIDDFVNYAVKSLNFAGELSKFSFSQYIIAVYLGLHLLGGIAAGIIAYKIKIRINSKLDQKNFTAELIKLKSNAELNIAKRKKKKIKLTHILILLLVTVLFVLTFLVPTEIEMQRFDLIFMVLRAIFILTFWYYFAAPYVKKLFQKILKKKQSKYASQINELIDLFPYLKNLFASVWKYSEKKKGLSRIFFFISISLTLFIAGEIDQ